MGEGTFEISQRLIPERLGKKWMVTRDGEKKNNGSNMRDLSIRQCVEEGSNIGRFGEGSL